MDQPTPSLPFWDSVRAWADSKGLLLPREEGPAGDPVRPRVPQSVCDSCPICQGAATLEQVNPELITDLAEMARSVVSGLASAMASASDQRDPGREPREDAGDVPAVTDLPEPAEGSVTDDYDDPDAADPDADGPQA